MRVLQIIPRFWNAGGDSVYALGLMEEMRGRGVTVEAFSTSGPRNLPATYARTFPLNVDFGVAVRNGTVARLLQAGTSSIYSRQARQGLREVLADFRPDLVHVHGLHQFFTVSCALELRRFGAPVIYTAHDYKLICGNTNLYNDRTGTICTKCLYTSWWRPVTEVCKKSSRVASVATALQSLTWQVSRSRELFAAVHAPSAFLGKLLAGDPVLAPRVFCLKLPVTPLTGLTPSLAPPPEPAVVFVGRLEASKGVLELAAVVRRIGCKLVVIGAGPLEARLREALADQRVDWKGWIPREQVGTLLPPGTIVAVPSMWYENQSLVVLECMQRGCCVVASDIGGIPEQIEDGRTGLLVPPGDVPALAAALSRVLADPALARGLGARASKRMASWMTPAEHTDAMLARYEAVLAASVRSR